MKRMLGIFLVLMLFAVLGFFMVGFQNSVPTNLTNASNATFQNQTKAMNITYVGLEMILYILIAAMVIGAAVFLYVKTRGFR